MELSLKLARILFFVDGVAPTPDDIKAAGAINGQICFRNARAIVSEGSLEECDGVAGKVPPTYSKLPTAEEAVAKRAAKIEALAAKVGDSPAPVAPVKAAKEPAAPKAASVTPAAQTGAGAGEPAVDPAKEVAPGVAPAGAAGVAWRSNNG